LYRFRIKNRSEAENLVDALREENYPLGRLYFGYLIFLATELDQDAASALVDAYKGLDSLTGPYLAGILCVDRINAKLNGRLEGIDKEDKETIESLTPSHLAYLTKREECTHIDLDVPEWRIDSMTRPTDHMARVLGLTGQMPCIAILDFKSQAEMEVVELPKEKEILVKFVRELVDELSQNENTNKRPMHGKSGRKHL